MDPLLEIDGAHMTGETSCSEALDTRRSGGSPDGEIRAPYLGICHLTDHYTCNLACPYCIAGRKVKKKAFSHATLKAVLERIRAIPRPVGLLLAQWGEFFTSPALMEEVTCLCNSPGNLVGVSVLTNLYADWDSVIRPFAEGVDGGRLTMGCTLHDKVITGKQVGLFFEKAARLHEMGVLVYVNYIITADDAVVKARSHKERCGALGIPFTLMPLLPFKPGQDRPAQYGSGGAMTPLSAEALRELKPLCDSPHAYRMCFNARTPSGMQCGAGRDYLYINAAGDIFPCCFSRPALAMGNILTRGVVAREEDVVCGEQFCFRPYDMSALRIVDRRYTRSRDFRLIRPREGLSPDELDGGYGMPLRHMKAVSELFPRASSGMKPHSESTGAR